jgi:predicted acyl esterase
MAERHVWIPMADGVRLAASLYLPDSRDPVPVLLEALPYRKDDVTAGDRTEYRRLAGEHGYAVARVDLRGTGSSEGVATDEYPPQEQADLCQVIDWLAAQPWSTGAVGMYGTSYSGFNSLQVAAERPPALKAIVAIYATDDRYTDDVHYVGGALRLLDLVDYPLYMVALNALPPVPALAGAGWRERWRERVEGLEPWLLRWLQEQVDGPYWRHGSLRPAYERIACPTMLVAGWADGYRNATFRVLERLRVPTRLLLGPWSHMATDSSLPGPRIDLVPELVRWWDRWLRGRRDGADAQAPVTVFVRHATRPAPDLAEVVGAWRDEPAWPPERAAELALPLGSGRDRLQVRPDVGVAGWIDCAGQLPFGQPDDQRADDAWSLTFDWPLEAELEVLGHPRLRVRVAASAPVAFLSAKLCDVFPDGTSAVVARGLLNLTHRRSHAEPAPLQPGQVEPVELELHATSWVFPAGHRLRLSLAGADWPNAVPPPAPVVLTVERDGSVLTLPVLRGPSPAPRTADPAGSGGAAPDPPAPPPPPPAGPDGSAADPPVEWRVVRDVLGRTTEAVIGHGGRTTLEGGAVVTERYGGTVGTALDRPWRTWAAGEAGYQVEWPEATVATTARLDLRADADAFEVRVDLEVREAGEPRWNRSWRRRIPRRLA